MPSSRGHVIALTKASYHNVDIAQVEIVNPLPGTVKFEENQEYGTSCDESTTDTKVLEKPPANQVNSGGNDETSDRVAVKPRGSATSHSTRRRSSAYRSNVNTPQSRHSAYRRTPQYYEVAPGVIIPDRPITTANRLQHNERDYNINKRATTAPHVSKSRLWVSNRSAASSRMSGSLWKWRLDEANKSKANHMIKMPFKQVPVVTLNKNYRIEDDLVDPSEDLRLTTAFTVKRVRNGLNRLPPPAPPPSDNGRLLKAKLRPLRPVHSRGPTIYTCEGIQPEFRKPKDSPSPSRMRQLKDQYLELCRHHQQQQDEEPEEITFADVEAIPPSSPQLLTESARYTAPSAPLPSPSREYVTISLPEVTGNQALNEDSNVMY